MIDPVTRAVRLDEQSSVDWLKRISLGCSQAGVRASAELSVHARPPASRRSRPAPARRVSRRRGPVASRAAGCSPRSGQAAGRACPAPRRRGRSRRPRRGATRRRPADGQRNRRRSVIRRKTSDHGSSGPSGKDLRPRPTEVVTPPETAPVVVVVGQIAIEATLRTTDLQPPVGTQSRHEQPRHPPVANRLIVHDERPTHRPEVDPSLDVLPRQVDSHLIAVGLHDHPVATDVQDTEVGRYLEFGVVEPLDGAGPLFRRGRSRSHVALTGVDLCPTFRC